MRTLIIMAAFFSSLGKLFGDDKPSYEVAEIYTDMREQVLKLNEKEMPRLKGKPVWAVLMETGFPEAAYTLVAAADGAASLYFSNGGGIVGAGEHEKVRPASLKMVKMAEDYLKHMKKVDKFPVVQPGKTTFYVVTPKGIFAYSAETDDLGEERDKKLSPLFYQGHELIRKIRMAEEKRQAEQDGKRQGE
ncbi:MAG: hypothetical protein AAGA58_07580 [Verrucomicrobiota bacterium]